MDRKYVLFNGLYPPSHPGSESIRQMEQKPRCFWPNSQMFVGLWHGMAEYIVGEIRGELAAEDAASAWQLDMVVLNAPNDSKSRDPLLGITSAHCLAHLHVCHVKV